MADRTPSIGRLRWPVTIATRVQTAAGTATIVEGLTEILQVRADIQPLGPMTFVASEQTDRPLTHRVYIRWLDWIDTTHVILRRTLRRDNSERREIFRIQKVAEDQGRKRHLELLVQLERRD